MPRLGSAQPRTSSLRLLVCTLLAGAFLFAAGAPRLDAQTFSKSKSRLAKAVATKDFRAATSAADDLVALGSTKAIEALITIGLSGDYYGFEKYVAGKLLGLPPGEMLDKVCELASKHKNSNARVLLTLVLGLRKEREAYKAVLQNLYDPEDGVVLTAIEKIAAKDDIGAIGHLIEALEHQEKRKRNDGLVAYEIRQLLHQLTREDMVRSVDWKNWWKPRKDNFERPPEGTEARGQVTSVYKKPSKFFGIEVPTERVIFILDVSGSMLIKDPAPEEPGDKEGESGGVSGGTSVGGRKKKKEKKPEPTQEEIPESRKRLTRVQKELIETIERLPEKTQFNIIIFNHEVKGFEEDLVPANTRNRKKAIDFVRGFKAEGETWTDHALSKAFEATKLRAIFLLSDGAPKRDGERLDVDPILEWVREANRFARIRLHTVGFEQAGSKMRKFMRRLAKQNHGDYVELK